MNIPDPIAPYIGAAKVIIVVLLFPAGFVAGCTDEKERFDAYKAQVEAAGKAQEDRTEARIAHDNLLKEEADSDHQERLDSLNSELARMRVQLAHAGSGIVPTVPKPPGGREGVDGGDAVVCFARDRLAEGVERAFQRFAAGSIGSLQFGARAIATSETCSGWAMKEWLSNTPARP